MSRTRGGDLAGRLPSARMTAATVKGAAHDPLQRSAPRDSCGSTSTRGPDHRARATGDPRYSAQARSSAPLHIALCIVAGADHGGRPVPHLRQSAPQSRVLRITFDLGLNAGHARSQRGIGWVPGPAPYLFRAASRLPGAACAPADQQVEFQRYQRDATTVAVTLCAGMRRFLRRRWTSRRVRRRLQRSRHPRSSSLKPNGCMIVVGDSGLAPHPRCRSR